MVLLCAGSFLANFFMCLGYHIIMTMSQVVKFCLITCSKTFNLSSGAVAVLETVKQGEQQTTNLIHFNSLVWLCTGLKNEKA